MFNKKHIVAVLSCLTLATNYGNAQQTDAEATRVAPESFSQSLFAKNDQIALMSHDGRWRGADNDLEVRLRRDGSVLVIDYGYAISKTRGKFKVKQDGTIVIIPAGKSPWLPMPCSIEKGMLVIHPPKKKFFSPPRERQESLKQNSPITPVTKAMTSGH